MGKVLPLNNLQKRGWQLPNRCHLCGSAEVTVHHILLHCPVVSSLWEIIFALVGSHWVLPSTVKEAVCSWRGSFVGKKRKKSGGQFLYVFFGQFGRRGIR